MRKERKEKGEKGKAKSFEKKEKGCFKKECI